VNLDVKGSASETELAALVAVLTSVLNRQPATPTWRETRRKALGMHRDT
jgi:hypothetical protein